MKIMFVILGMVVATGQAGATEEPEYRVVKTFPAFELRLYEPSLVAIVESDAAFDEAGNEVFRILAGYIFGKNRRNESIGMTAPVTQSPAGEKIGMTAPVAQTRAASGRWEIAFVMPSRYTRATLPEPLDPRIRIREVPARLVAVLRYSGSWSETSYRKREAALLAGIRAAGLTSVGAPVWARYNSPFSLPPFRRNEVMQEVASAE